jgi:hypothetical protein
MLVVSCTGYSRPPKLLAFPGPTDLCWLIPSPDIAHEMHVPVSYETPRPGTAKQSLPGCVYDVKFPDGRSGAATINRLNDVFFPSGGCDADAPTPVVGRLRAELYGGLPQLGHACYQPLEPRNAAHSTYPTLFAGEGQLLFAFSPPFVYTDERASHAVRASDVLPSTETERLTAAIAMMHIAMRHACESNERLCTPAS